MSAYVKILLRFDKEVIIDAADIAPTVTWGTSPQDTVSITGVVPDPKDCPDPTRRAGIERSLAYMGLTDKVCVLNRINFYLMASRMEAPCVLFLPHYSFVLSLKGGRGTGLDPHREGLHRFLHQRAHRGHARRGFRSEGPQGGTGYKLSAVCCLLPTACCLLSAACCLLSDT
jgi:hypothetical protein